MTALQSNVRDLGRRPKVGSAVAANDKAADPGGLGLPISQAPLRDVTAGVVDVSGGGAPGALTYRLAALLQLSLTDLRREWRRLFRLDPPRLSRDLMTRAIAHRLQEVAHGGMAKATERRLSALAEKFEVDGTIAPPSETRIKPGSRLVREWHGRTHTVEVTDSGFEYEGKPYRSLTKIAFEITGAQWSGPRFFGLTKKGASATARSIDVKRGEGNANG